MWPEILTNGSFSKYQVHVISTRQIKWVSEHFPRFFDLTRM